MLRVIIAISFFLLALTSVYAVEEAHTLASPRYNIQEYDPERLPEITFFDEQDKAHLLDEFEGQVVVLTFWATWCTSCLNEIQDLDLLQKEFKKKPLKIIAVSQDFKGMSAVDEFYKLHSIKYLDKYIDQKSKLFNVFNVIGIPTSIIIDYKNREVGRVVGAVDWSDPELHNLLNKYLQAVPNFKDDEAETTLKSSSNKQNLILNVNPSKSVSAKDISSDSNKDKPKEASPIINDKKTENKAPIIDESKSAKDTSSLIDQGKSNKNNHILKEAVTNIVPKPR